MSAPAGDGGGTDGALPFSLRKLGPVTPPAGLAVECHRLSMPAFSMDWAIAVVAVRGAFPDGSAGREHARYLKLACLEAMARMDALCLILDFREATYGWGDSLIDVFTTLDRHFYYEWHDIGMRMPIKLLASESSSGLLSLVRPECLFPTLEAAIDSCRRDLERYMADDDDG